MSCVACVGVAVVFVCLIYFWLKWTNGYWKRRNIPHREPTIFFGNLKDIFLMKEQLFQVYTDIYRQFNDFPYVGFYKLRTPGLLIRDPQLVHDVMTKDFTSFEENDLKIDENVDPLGGRNPIFMTGQAWKTARTRLSGCFTSGKLKMMLPLMVKVTEDMIKYIEEHGKTINTKELAAKFTTDNVASCGFGLEAKSFTESEAEFLRIGMMIFKPSFTQMFKIALVAMVPGLNDYLKMKFMPKEAEDYFCGVVATTLKYREENNVVRNDFLDIVNNIRKQDPTYTIIDVTSNALSLFADGFETSSLALCFALYELAANPSAQEKLKNEIEEKLTKSKGVLTYECLQEMGYLERAVQESLRLHPPIGALVKICTKDYAFPPINSNEKELILKAGSPITISVLGIHTDPNIYPDAEVFDPDRFSEENRTSIAKGSYLPFGDGPRVCLGQRFALLQVKVAIVAVIRNFEIRVNPKTKQPVEYDNKYFMLSPKGELLLDYYKRQ